MMRSGSSPRMAWTASCSMRTATGRIARGTVSDVDQETAERLLRDARAAPLALLPGASLARSTLHRMDAEHHILVWSFSHAVVDGWSLGTLWDDFVVAYRGGSESPAAGSYADFLGRQRVVEPPPSAAHLEAQAAPGTLEVRIDESARARIEEHCRRVDTTPYLVLLDSLLRAIEECEIVSPDVRVWSPHAGRDSVDDAACRWNVRARGGCWWARCTRARGRP
ncbi:condensation domain-containing protein [Paeniglutamicibacter kerguelensis]|uniref:condensation domain-containing protein n=1 Tax=Paeniglutamicibacter kerguelensis TaxID=254788 RepID=UPI00361AEB12